MVAPIARRRRQCDAAFGTWSSGAPGGHRLGGFAAVQVGVQGI